MYNIYTTCEHGSRHASMQTIFAAEEQIEEM